jgi:thiamine pyrophosphate-dependent acetolactate synthase large subunit-like protein
MRELLQDYYNGDLSRRRFLKRLAEAGLTAAAARSIVDAADAAETQTAEKMAENGGRYKVITGSGGELLVEQARAAGVKYIFTNPGSYEVGFFDALVDRPDLQVIVGLHEGIVVPMADGYHKATGELAFVNVHAVAGTAQMAGQLYNAHRDGSAIVVTAGMQDAANYSDDVLLAPRPGFSQTEVNRQFTKISWEVRNGASIPVFMRRAFKTAMTAPGGPVYICFSSFALETPNLKGEIWPRENFLIQARPRPAKDQVEQLAKMLIESQRPVAVFGDEVWKSKGQAEAIELCEMLGLAAATGGQLQQAFPNFPTRHPQYIGQYAPDRAYPAGQADLFVQFGTRDPGGMQVPDKPMFDTSAQSVAVGLDTNMMGRTQPVDLAIVADVRETFRDLKDAVSSMATDARLQKIRNERLAKVKPHVANMQAMQLENAKKNFDRRPIHPDRVGLELDAVADPDAIIVSENLTGSNGLFRLGHRADEKLWLGNTGAALGWGVGAAIGAKLGAPNRQVILSIGDGSVMYSASGFWTMARYSVPILTVVWNNYNYQTVRNAYVRYGKRMAATGQFHGLYLGDPEIDFVKLAESQGVRGEKVTEPGDLKAALTRGIQATRDGKPYLVEIIISRVGGGADSTWHQKFDLAAQRSRNV